ncbi:DUF58 domain-containing protein [Halosimplex sp. TS25]|uniref:DUF58 domain-containing protein n=1 Tax=Halosimplex rarum TaxID=3396619 RepID=UPI0039ED2F87
MSRERVYRLRIGAVAAAALVALGLLFASPLLLASTAVPLAYVAYGALSTVPADAAIRVERSFSDATPRPGASVTVDVTVENVSDGTLPDVRIVDGVPDDLAVVDGSPRRCVTLRPGESATLTYDVVALRGEFEFADPVVRLRPFAAGRVVTESVPAAGDGTLSSLDPVSAAPVGSATLARAGTHPTDSGGEGLEFHSTREYRPGDSISRIHWRRFAKTNQLTTVSYREERAVRVVVVVDARPVGRVRPHAGAPTAASLTGYAAERIYESLVDADVTTGAAAFGVDGADPSVSTGVGPVPWIAGDRDDAVAHARALFDAVQRVADDPDDGGRGARSATGGTNVESPRTNARRADANDRPGGIELSGDASGDESATAPETATPDGGADAVRYLLSQFPPMAHVVFVTPVLDDWPVNFVRRVRQREYPITVLSPGATGSDSLGARVASHERDVRMQDLSATGATVVDWDRSDAVDAALADALASLPGGSHG